MLDILYFATVFLDPTLIVNAISVVDTLLYVNLIAIIFYPLFMIALTFMRLLTSLSLTTIISSIYGQEYFNKTDRFKLLISGILIICLYFYINIYLNGVFDTGVLPFFDSYYFK